MDRTALMNIPEVANAVSGMNAQDQDMLLGLLAAITNQMGVPTQRTQARRDAGVPAQSYRLFSAYYSVVRFAGTVTTGGGNTTVTWQQGLEARAFSYRIGDPLTGAGFPATFGPNALATAADTNLTTAGQTLAGDQVMVYGFSAMTGTTTDTGAFAFLNDAMSVRISMDGDRTSQRYGRPIMIPASGGIYGLASSVISPFANGFASNGMPIITNYYPFDQPILWTSSGQTDSILNIIAKLERAVSLTSPTTATSPTDSNSPGAYVDILWRLHTDQTGARSLNQ